MFALILGPRKANTDSFLNHRPFELGKNAHHLKHGLAGGCRGVETLLMQEQVDAKRMQLGKEANQVLQAARKWTLPASQLDHFSCPGDGSGADGAMLAAPA